MTWSDRAGGGEKAGGGDGLAPVRVMTDEQIEVLRHQIAQYTVICEELVEMHRVHTAQHGYLAGPLIGPMYYDPMTVPRITARQRWTPTPSQLQILERLFDQGIGTPSKAKIKELAEELSEHGPISEANVYNWFQNRRARSKRKQQTNCVPNNSESEAETDFESPDEKKAKLEKMHPHDKLSHSAGHLTFRSSETSPEASSSNQDTEKTQGTRNLMGEMRVPESYMTLHQKKCFYMAG